MAKRRPKRREGGKQTASRQKSMTKHRGSVGISVSANTGRWSKAEHAAFLQGMEDFPKEWKKIAQLVGTRTILQVRTHAQKFFISHKMEGNLNTHKRKWHVESDYLEVDNSPHQADLPGLHAKSADVAAKRPRLGATERAGEHNKRSSMISPTGHTTNLRNRLRTGGASVDLPLDRTATAGDAANAGFIHNASGRRVYDFEALSSAASYCIDSSTKTASSGKFIRSNDSGSVVLGTGADANAQAAAALAMLMTSSFS